MASVIPRLKCFALLPAIVLFAALPAHGLFKAKAGSKAAERAGAVLFRDKGCAHCHGVGGIGTQKAPSLVDLRKNKLWTPARITDQILTGGQKMPPFSDSVTDEEAAQLVAYLRAKHRPVPPPALPTHQGQT
jgi:mono/diheme cytochrome c family protein